MFDCQTSQGNLAMLFLKPGDQKMDLFLEKKKIRVLSTGVETMVYIL